MSVSKEKCRDEKFGVRVGLHQGSVLKPFFFNIVFDVFIEDVRVRTLWNMMYIDLVVLVSEPKEGIENRLND